MYSIQCLEVSAFGSQSLSATCWSMAKAMWRHEGLLEAISNETKQKAASFAPQNLANSSWAFAKLQASEQKES